MKRLLFCWVCLLGFSVSAPAPLMAQYSSDERFLAGLRAARLFDLADEVCRNRLSASKLTPRERVVITVERMLVQTEKGVNEPLAERPAVFKAAREIASEFARTHAENPRGVLVRFQDALTVLTLGELERLEADLGTASPAEIEAARKTLREAVNLLETFDSELQKQIPSARRGSEKDAITADELTSLRTHVQFQLARAARNQAQLYPEKSEDRTASLLRGKRQLEEAVCALGDEDPTYWRAATELASFERMLGDLGRATQLLEELEAKGPPSHALPALRAEQIRFLIASGKASIAVTQGAKWAEAISPRDPDLDLAFLEAVVTDKGSAKTTSSLMEKLTDIENRHGPYWGRRGSALVLKDAPAGMASGNLELLSRTADQLYLQKNYEAAITAYDQAAQKAREAKKDAQFVDLANKAALVEQQRKGYSEAVRRFLELAAAPEAKSIAAEAHLAAAWNQAQLVAADPKDAKVFVRYEEILKDQIAKFKDSPAAATAKLWLARIYESRREFDGAYAAAIAIPTDSKEASEALEIGLRYWTRREKTFDDPKFDRVGPALEWSKKSEGDFSIPIQRKIGVAAIRWELLIRDHANHEAIEQKLRTLIEKTPKDEPELLSAAHTLLVVALAAQPTKQEEAAKLLSEAGGTAKQRLAALQGLVKLAKTAGSRVQPALGEFVLVAIEKLKPVLSDLSASDKVLVDLAYAEGLIAKGDFQNGAKAFETLATKHGNSAVVQEAYAMYLQTARGGHPGAHPPTAALDQWRIVASRSEPRSERWFRAKYYVAKTQFEMGQKAEAAKLIDFLDATPPGLKGTPMEAEFRELRKSCDRSAGKG